MGLLKSAIGAMLVFDVTNKESFANMEGWLDEVKKNTSANIVICLVGNKTDLEEK